MSLAYRNSWWQAGRKCADMYAGDYYCIRGARFTLMRMQYTFVPPLTYMILAYPDLEIEFTVVAMLVRM